MASVGAVTVYVCVAVPVFPATSVAVAVSVCVPTAGVYPVTTHDPGPEPASTEVHVGAAGTEPGLTLPTCALKRAVGAVVSIRMPCTLAVVRLPARSVAVPLAVCTPSVAKDCGAGQVATPDSASVQVKSTVTGPTYQPAEPFAPSTTVATRTGPSASMRTVNDRA